MEFLLIPPVTLVFFLLVSMLFSRAFSGLAPTGKDTPGKFRPYACGEDMAVNKVAPDYSQFYPFAFFFTVMHVLVLVVATVPAGTWVLPFAYLATGLLSLRILFGR